MGDVETQLSISRIHRLLRPLRCALATNPTLPSQAQSKTSRTYSSRQANVIVRSEVAPLTKIPPPDRATLYANVSKEERTKIVELSRKIYSVRDCFRNVIASVLGEGGEILGQARLPSLASMCATKLGEGLNQYKEETGDDGSGDSDILEPIFELVPVHQRRWSLIAHALDEILLACSPHPTLLVLLLDICMSYNLCRESARLLRSLLTLSFSPLSDFEDKPMISHPSHSTYLTDLLDAWTRNDQTTSQFVDIFVEVLSQPCYSDAWTSKAVLRLAHWLRIQTFPLFLRMIHGLMTCIRNTKINRQIIRTVTPRLLNQLTTWMSSLVDHIVATKISGTPQLPLPLLQSLELIDLAQSLRLQHMTATGDIAGLFVSFTTISLSLGICSPIAISFLADIDPKTTTYDTLIESLFSPISGSNYQTSDLRTFITILEEYVAALKSTQLLRLEASLWTCALRHFDRIRLTRDQEIDREAGCIKIALMAGVERSEKQCFGASPSDSCLNLQRFQTSSDYAWEWEASIESWVRRNSPQASYTKKRKYDEPRTRSSASLRARRLSESSGSANPIRSWSAPCPPSGPLRDSNNDNGRTPQVDVKPGFASLLSTALSKRTVLHSEGSIGRRRSSSASTCKSCNLLPVTTTDFVGLTERSSSPPTPPIHIPSSEDALNLFAYDDDL